MCFALNTLKARIRILSVQSECNLNTRGPIYLPKPFTDDTRKNRMRGARLVLRRVKKTGIDQNPAGVENGTITNQMCLFIMETTSPQNLCTIN